MTIDPTDSTHTLNIIPRFYPDNTIVVELYNEASKETNTPTATYSITNGILDIEFTFTFVDKDRHQIKVTEGTDVVYRGKLLTTTQEPQDFKLTNDIYIYS